LRIVRLRIPPMGPRLGIVDDGEINILPEKEYGSKRGFLKLLREASRRGISLDEYLSTKYKRGGLKKLNLAELDNLGEKRFQLLIPFSPPEVWGAGVTYIRSREAREHETSAKGIYEKVYEAERPEIFFKATPSRCVGPGETAYIRSDTNWAVPEPELGLVLGFNGEIVGYTIGNDLSARDIEGENPLYLPQAKIYRGCCAIGPAVSTPETVRNPKNLRIEMRITRNGEEVFRGNVNTSSLKREFDELVAYLIRDNIIPPGTILLTGTGIVPPDDFSLQHGDIVEIEVEKIGVLRNRIEKLSSLRRQS